MNIAFAIDSRYTPSPRKRWLSRFVIIIKKLIFYVLHHDIPKEWFEGIQSKLEKMGNNLFSVYISDDIFKDYKTLEHISSSSSYYRFLIPKLINQDRVLYLDADIIVNGSLRDFYYSDLENTPVGVVRDYCTMQTFPIPLFRWVRFKKLF